MTATKLDMDLRRGLQPVYLRPLPPPVAFRIALRQTTSRRTGRKRDGRREGSTSVGFRRVQASGNPTVLRMDSEVERVYGPSLSHLQDSPTVNISHPPSNRAVRAQATASGARRC